MRVHHELHGCSCRIFGSTSAVGAAFVPRRPVDTLSVCLSHEHSSRPDTSVCMCTSVHDMPVLLDPTRWCCS